MFGIFNYRRWAFLIVMDCPIAWVQPILLFSNGFKKSGFDHQSGDIQPISRFYFTAAVNTHGVSAWLKNTKFCATIHVCIVDDNYSKQPCMRHKEKVIKGDKATPKQRIFQTAEQLFYQKGYRAIGVDTIVAESGVGKMTLYRHYPSKDDLIVAYLRERNEICWNNFEQIAMKISPPRGKLMAVFQFLQEYVKNSAHHGCSFLNIATEYPKTDFPGHQVALEHKQSVRACLHQMTRETVQKNPKFLQINFF